jgi:16S rRNA (cytosine967-C5)-methyltransferase
VLLWWGFGLATTTRQVDARRLAWEVLLAVERGAFADAELARRLSSVTLDLRDRSLATRLVYGTLAWQGYLDHVIAALCRQPAQLDPPVRTLLRLALFQIERLSRVPDFAAVDSAVELSKRFRSGAASGMVNAVLRRHLRERGRIRVPDRADDLAGFLSVSLSHPRWLVEQWLARFGAAETESLLAGNNEPAPTVLRVNRLRAEPEAVMEQLGEFGVSATPSNFAPDGIILEHGGDPAALPGFAEGRFSSQGEASQLVTRLIGAQRGDRILDACAAPGGKSTYLAELLQNEGEVVAVDRDEHGLAHLRQAAQRLGLRCIRTVPGDVAEFVSARGDLFDAVLLDAPCSGLGTLRQHPEIRWRRTPASIAEVAHTQRRLLDAIVGAVRPGGVVVYATCTLTTIENESVVEDFLAAHGDFNLQDPRPYLSPTARLFVDDTCLFRTYPHSQGLDGFFAARLQRRR